MTFAILIALWVLACVAFVAIMWLFSRRPGDAVGTGGVDWELFDRLRDGWARPQAPGFAPRITEANRTSRSGG